MRGNLFCHNVASDFSGLDDDIRSHLNDLLAVVRLMPKSIWPDKSDKQKNKSVLQGMHNAYFRQRLHTLAWAVEPCVTEDDASARKADFSVGVGAMRILAEVEFGNTARIDSNLFKFLEAHCRKELGVAVLLLPMAVMAKETDSGVATFEVICARVAALPSEMVPYRLVVIGLEPDEHTQVLDWSTSAFSTAKDLSGNGDKSVLAHATHKYLTGTPLREIGHPRLTLEHSEARARAKSIQRARQPNQAGLFDEGLFVLET